MQAIRQSLLNRFCARASAALLSLLAALCFTNAARADEGGVSFWVPGFFGSLAAAPQQPGWALAVINYYDSVRASGNVAAARQVTINKFNATVNVNLNANLRANPNLVLAIPRSASAFRLATSPPAKFVVICPAEICRAKTTSGPALTDV